MTPIAIAALTIGVLMIVRSGKKTMRVDAYKDGKPYKIDVEQIDGVWLSFVAARRWERMRDAAARIGVRLKLNSGFRSMADQTRLWNMSPKEREVHNVGALVSKPGYSTHQTGNAIDISIRGAGVLDWLRANASLYGWQNTVPEEPWHYVTIA